jgi:lipopolysaccharide transport system permease protein
LYKPYAPDPPHSCAGGAARTTWLPIDIMTTRTIIEAGKSDTQYLRDLWKFRELFYVLAWRDVSVRYKQTVVGIAWALLRPALSTVAFTVVFGRLGKFPSAGAPYPVVVLTGLLPWQLFSTGLTESGSSVVANASLITKVYFPRLIIPGSALVVSCVDFSISLILLVTVMIAYGVAPTWRLALLPMSVAYTIFTAAAFGVWFAALNVRYRDFAFVVPFVLQLGLYVSPVGFSSVAVPTKWRALYATNPMVGVVEGFRWCVLGGTGAVYWPGVGVSLLVVAIIGMAGLSYFRATEREFSDVI